jgi:GT2 family glycosyltransferase
MDSDILLAKNYLLEMSVRLQIIPNAIFLSFKENVEMGQSVTDDGAILAGLPKPNTENDKRISRQLKKDQINHHKIDYDIGVEILNDTNYFKDLGFGRIMGGFDLPAMVVGHNMCLKKDIVKEIGGFSDHFKGWGLEDTYFGARVIAAGNFVIPVLSTGVYHINHPPRSGSEEQRQKEYAENIAKYIELIREPLT